MKTRIIYQKSWKMFQLITKSKVISLYKVMNLSDGGDKKWHIGIQDRSETGL